MNGHLSPGMLIGGRYRLGALIGAGGMGEVYRAEDERTGRQVAAKIFSATTVDARDLARFYHEARVHHSLEHPHIVRVHELVTVESRPGLIMEYVDGESLAARLSRLGRIEPAEALGYVRDLASALGYVHERGIVHRDVKPANVRLTSAGVVKLLDFGIAKSAHVHGLTKTGNVIGTPRYLSPEQLVGEPVTPASDVWALGVVLYELVTGRLPFEGDSITDLWKAIEASRSPRPSDVARPSTSDGAALMAGVDALVAQCLARDPKRRPASGAAVVGRVDRVNAVPDTSRIPAIGDAAVFAPRRPRALFMTVGAMARAFASNRRAWVIAAAAAVGIVVVATWLWYPTPDTGERAVEHIESTADPADVVVNGHRVGQTPIDYAGRVGLEIAIELRKDGYEPAHADVQMTVHGSTTLALAPIGRLP